MEHNVATLQKSQTGAPNCSPGDRSGEVGRRHFGHDQWSLASRARFARPQVEAAVGACQRPSGGRRLGVNGLTLNWSGHPVHLSRGVHERFYSSPRAERTIRRRLLLLTLALAGVLRCRRPSRSSIPGHRRGACRRTTRASRPPGSGSESGWSCITRRFCPRDRPVSRQGERGGAPLHHPAKLAVGLDWRQPISSNAPLRSPHDPGDPPPETPGARRRRKLAGGWSMHSPHIHAVYDPNRSTAIVRTVDGRQHRSCTRWSKTRRAARHRWLSRRHRPRDSATIRWASEINPLRWSAHGGVI